MISATIFNVSFGDLTVNVTYKGNEYVLYDSYPIGNGVGWHDTGAMTDTGAGFNDVATVTFDGTTVAGRVDSRTGTAGWRRSLPGRIRSLPRW